LYDISVQVSLSSRVACVGENGAGKSTMIKLLVGEIEPQTGEVWKHPNARIAYVAQHAFHHIESHLDKTPNEYIPWRYANNGEDKESLVKVTMQFTPEEEKKQRTPYELQFTDPDSGKITKVKKVVAELVGGRKTNKAKEYEYEVKYAGSTVDSGEYLPMKTLKKMGWEKAMKAVDLKIAQPIFLRVFIGRYSPESTVDPAYLTSYSYSLALLVFLPPTNSATTFLTLVIFPESGSVN
jgi:elongation factor 3